MATTQKPRAKMIPEGAKITIENEYRHKVIEFRRRKFDIPMSQANQWRMGAEFGYSLAQQEIERLKELLEQYEERETNPYWYFPQCDVDGCEGVTCNGGGCWRDTGYWNVCPEHSQEFREGKPQPKMKQSAIEREASRDKITGVLPAKINS